MYAVVRTGGKQYRVAAEDKITVERLPGEAGDVITLDDVLMIGDGASLQAGKGEVVHAEILEQIRGEKVIIFKKRRRHNYRRRNGHRQNLTVLQITAIGGAAPAKQAAAKKQAPKTEAATETKADGAPALDTSNLSLISGVGPTIEKKLRAAGIKTWDDIAAWTEADIARWDEELKLRGRATREEWVEQAKELLAGKPPRAKVDQAEAASGKDQ